MALDMETLRLDSGVELPYLEFGKDNEEVLVVGQYYFDSFIPWLTALSEYFHVYAVTMRTHEPLFNYYNEKGEPDWMSMWVDEIYEFCKKKGLKQFYYAGKCHGASPGWTMMYRHPEVLKGLISVSITPLPRGVGEDPVAEMFKIERFRNVWQYMATDPHKFCSLNLRNQDLVETKVKEMETADISATTKGENLQIPELKTNDAVMEYVKTINTPVFIQMALDDVTVRLDWFIKSIVEIKGCEVMCYQGERHFCEMDIPKKLAYDAISWVKRQGLAE